MKTGKYRFKVEFTSDHSGSTPEYIEVDITEDMISKIRKATIFLKDNPEMRAVIMDAQAEFYEEIYADQPPKKQYWPADVEFSVQSDGGFCVRASGDFESDSVIEAFGFNETNIYEFLID